RRCGRPVAAQGSVEKPEEGGEREEGVVFLTSLENHDFRNSLILSKKLAFTWTIVHKERTACHKIFIWICRAL
ncbi:hypothetical protein, partial [Sutterella sp.]|uniref:hypothetical protein n=1 Tax=Sutterella sp. TaxID=1981025 RepID=UPI003FD7EC24